MEDAERGRRGDAETLFSRRGGRWRGDLARFGSRAGIGGRARNFALYENFQEFCEKSYNALYCKGIKIFQKRKKCVAFYQMWGIIKNREGAKNEDLRDVNQKR
jgi:hypothetical protein